MALYEDVRGAIHSQCLPFPLNEKRSSSRTNYALLLGKEFDLPNGLKAVLVQADAAVTSPGKKLFRFKDTDAYEVEISQASAEAVCGVAHPLLEDLAADDYFFLLVVPTGRQVTMTCDASGVAAVGRTLQSSGTTDGMVEDTGGTTVTAGTTVGIALEASVAASADIRVLVVDGAFRGDNA